MKMTPIAHHAKSRIKSGRETECLMVTIAVGVLIVFATTMLRSRSSSIELSAATIPQLQELHAMVGVNTLPTEEIEDLSLVFPIVTRR
jgi:hypothetical protein